MPALSDRLMARGHGHASTGRHACARTHTSTVVHPQAHLAWSSHECTCQAREEHTGQNPSNPVEPQR
eukprot:14803467-Alexandrium_andersonii.AAC.1